MKVNANYPSSITRIDDFNLGKATEKNNTYLPYLPWVFTLEYQHW